MGSLAEINSVSDPSHTGLEKLVEASYAVAELAKELAVKEKELEIASSVAEDVLKDVTVKAQAAEKVKNQVQKVKDKAQAIVDEIEHDKVSFVTRRLRQIECASQDCHSAQVCTKTVSSPSQDPFLKSHKHPNELIYLKDDVAITDPRELIHCLTPPFTGDRRGEAGSGASCARGGGGGAQHHQTGRHRDGAQTGQASAPHHAHHGLRAAAVPAPSRRDAAGPGEGVHEAVLERVAQGRWP